MDAWQPPEGSYDRPCSKERGSQNGPPAHQSQCVKGAGDQIGFDTRSFSVRNPFPSRVLGIPDRSLDPLSRSSIRMPAPPRRATGLPCATHATLCLKRDCSSLLCRWSAADRDARRYPGSGPVAAAATASAVLALKHYQMHPVPNMPASPKRRSPLRLCLDDGRVQWRRARWKGALPLRLAEGHKARHAPIGRLARLLQRQLLTRQIPQHSRRSESA